MPPPPLGPWSALLGGAGPLGLKVFPRVDSQLLGSLASLDFHIAKISSFIRIILASVALKSSNESRQRDSWCIPYAISHSALTVRGLSLAYSQTIG